jgi:hypothetical protein
MACAAQQLFNHLVGKRQQVRRHVTARRLGGLEIDDEFKSGRICDRKLADLRAAGRFAPARLRSIQEYQVRAP